jgi:hypothetical protein
MVHVMQAQEDSDAPSLTVRPGLPPHAEVRLLAAPLYFLSGWCPTKLSPRVEWVGELMKEPDWCLVESLLQTALWASYACHLEAM